MICQHIVTLHRHKNRAEYLVPSQCKATPRVGDYCDFHWAGAEIMEIGARLGYPCFAVPNALKSGEGLEIGEGRVGWEAYAVVATPERVRQIRRSIEPR